VATQPITLVLQRPDKPERRFELGYGVYPVGTDAENRIVIPGDGIAWRHAILTFLPEGAWLEDLGSAGGTQVDGARVSGRVGLRAGQQVALGRCRLSWQPTADAPVFYFEDELPATPPAPAAPAEPPPVSADPPALPPDPATPAVTDARKGVKKQIHEELIRRLELRRLTASRIGEKDLRERVQKTIRDIVQEVHAKLPPGLDREGLAKEVFDEAVGLGPLEDLLADASITEIMVNGPERVYIERQGRLELTDRSFIDDSSVHAVIERIVAPIGRRIDESQPYVDARLPDGSRVNAIIHPLSLSGPCLTVRKFSREPLRVEDLVRYDTLVPAIADFLRAAVRLRRNIVVSGGTGTGKTTLLNVISGYIPDTERIITIEDAAELRLRQEPRDPAGGAARPTSRAAAPSPSVTSCATRCACGRTASWWANAAAARRSTCCRP
jgi:pilus assembly protein CpaF